MQKLNRTILVTAVLGAAWVATVAFGMRLLHSNTSTGFAGVFPRDAALYLAADKPTLILIPEAGGPAAQASLTELAETVTAFEGNLKTYILFAAPIGSGNARTDQKLWETACAISGVIPVGDAEGREARRFGVGTSGRTLLFAPDGRLLSSGDIAQARQCAVEFASGQSFAPDVRTASLR